ncbi:tyrosine-type recombinase/integrase [Paenibacillus sp. Soil787]|uniref:tyrosine-type recombinase/integrase n=1 Tax=Paenibacillus sp. Soil787 TaxID=1736411 RepID=UPI000702EF77|nr:site-specific integrase [Paenibacillus sp. Soil787]KRF22520.1 hypothetical protein ASG93_29835 [Paenibacillus sp. Soil787]
MANVLQFTKNPITKLPDGKWILEWEEGHRSYKTSLLWKHIPHAYRFFWETIVQHFIDKQMFHTAKDIVPAIQVFHEWINPTDIIWDGYDDLDEFHFAAFAAWCEKEKKHKPATIRQRLVNLRLAFLQADQLSLPQASAITAEAILKVTSTHFKDLNARMAEDNSDRVLVEKQLTKLLEAARKEKDKCLDSSPDNSEEKYKNDFLVVVAFWLGYKYGIRTVELLNLKVTDVIDEKNGMLRCQKAVGRGKGKPEREIHFADDASLGLLRKYIAWSAPIRKKLGTDALCVSLVRNKKFKDRVVPRVTDANLMNQVHYKKFQKKYDISFDSFNGTNLRRTFGSNLAKFTDNLAIAQSLLGHENVLTTQKHYIAQNNIELSHQVTDAFGIRAAEIAFSRRNPCVSDEEFIKEHPELAAKYEAEKKKRDVTLGVCSAPTNDDTDEIDCQRKIIGCIGCKKLVPMANKLQNYKRELQRVLKDAEDDSFDRTKQNSINRAEMFKAWIHLIEEAVAKVIIKEPDAKLGSIRKRVTKKEK